jgi:uncharacterized membrane protein YcaP (DUF421 family)
MPLFPDDWAKLFLPQVPIFESIIRATVIYLLLLVVLRIVLKRETGGTSLSDILVLVLIADAVQNGVQGQATSIADAIILGGTLIFWDWMITYLSYRSHRFYRLVHPRPLPIIIDGKVLRKNARRELLTIQEIKEEMHLQGIDNIANVERATVQSNGEISFIAKKDNEAVNKNIEKSPSV